MATKKARSGITRASPRGCCSADCCVTPATTNLSTRRNSPATSLTSGCCPAPLDRILAIILPWNEMIVGACLIIGIWTRAAALVSLYFFIIFALAVGSAIARNLNIECGCLGNADASKVGFLTLGKDAIGLTLALIVFFSNTLSQTAREVTAIRNGALASGRPD